MFVILAAVILAMVATVAIWVALGSGPFLRRVIVGIPVTSAMGFLFCATSGEFEVEWLILCWVVGITVGLVMSCVRHLGFQLGREDASPTDAKAQFSLLHMLMLTGMVAVAIAVSKLLEPSSSSLIFSLVIASCLSLLPPPAIWATLRANISSAGFAAFAGIASLAATLIYFSVEATGVDPGSIWAMILIVYTAVLTGMLLLARSWGFRFSRSGHVD